MEAPRPVEAALREAPELVIAEGDLAPLAWKRRLPDPGDKTKTYEAFWFDVLRVKSVKLVELHADYLAGFFLANRKREHPTLSLQNVGRTFERFGDTNFGHWRHHGTPEERIAALEAGYFKGKSTHSTVMQAAELGAAFVRRLA